MNPVKCSAMSDQCTLTFLTQYFSRAIPFLAILSSIIDSVTCQEFFIHISPYIRSQCSPNFLLDSASMKLFLATCKACKFVFTISLVVAVSNAGNWWVKIEGVFILKPNTSSFGLCLKWFWRAFLALAVATSGSYFSCSYALSITLPTMRLWHSTVQLLNGLSAAVVHVSIFSFSFICQYSSLLNSPHCH